MPELLCAAGGKAGPDACAFPCIPGRKPVSFVLPLDFPTFFPYNTTIGNDGTKYPGQVRLKRAFGRCEKAAAAPVNTSPSPAVNLSFPSSGPTVRRLQRRGLQGPLRARPRAKTEVVPRFSVAFLPKREGGGFLFSGRRSPAMQKEGF